MSEPASPEFGRVVRAYPLPPEHLAISADEAERAALAARFGIERLDSLSAELALERNGDAVIARGTMSAALVQNCAVSGEPFATGIDEPLDLRFVPAGTLPESEEEIELASGGPDEIEFAGDSFDLGEAVAQSLGLAIDPYAEGPGADEARRAAGIVIEGEGEGALAELLRGLKPG
ncbi:MAG: DUF177 domain-containing protein [Cypionkella sp.]